jgi:hypothetical protein
MSGDATEPGPDPTPADAGQAPEGPDAAAEGGDPREGMGEATRQVLVGLAVVALATGLFIAVVSAMDAISTWLRPEWVPLAQTALGLVLAIGSLAALAYLVRRGGG